jgi:hypothetical protein
MIKNNNKMNKNNNKIKFNYLMIIIKHLIFRMINNKHLIYLD